MTIKTCLVGQSNLFRAGLKRLLTNTAFQVTHETETLSQLDGALAGTELLIIDKPKDARDIERDLADAKSMGGDCKIVLLSNSMKTEEMAWSFACGADGYLLEEISPEALLESLQLVMLGEKVFPSRLAILLSRDCSPYPQPENGAVNGALSPREAQIVGLLATGLPNKLIAKELNITEATVKVHLKTVLKKLGVSNRTQAAIWAVKNGLAPLPSVFVAADAAPSRPTEGL